MDTFYINKGIFIRCVLFNLILDNLLVTMTHIVLVLVALFVFNCLAVEKRRDDKVCLKTLCFISHLKF